MYTESSKKKLGYRNLPMPRQKRSHGPTCGRGRGGGSKGRARESIQDHKKSVYIEKSTGGPIKDKYGTLLNTEKEQDERWIAYFHEVLTLTSQIETAVIPEATEDLDIDTHLQRKMK